ncbi:hypothetical protein JOC48_003191 [Aquibacillus albus]|uniref:Uncharacterized protein n=1 Tax=Aquibacillus albus TaxID=1168171 RepID=A0ABS2N3F3_9BACI|nr:hypothetical protein [Aquibacillus albus]
MPFYVFDPYEHIKIFCHYLFQSITDITTLYPELAKYLNDIKLHPNRVIK